MEILGMATLAAIGWAIVKILGWIFKK